MKKVWAVTLATALVLMHPVVEAKRMGGGGSLGKQSSNVTQRQATPPAAPPARPAQQQQAQPAQNNAAARPGTPAAAPAKKPWGAMLGGLAAGLGLAWLANALGFGEAFANMLMFGLLALVIMLVVGAILRARANKKSPAAARANHTPFAFQGAGAPVPPAEVATPPQYKSHNVGNDASARPWEQIPGGSGSLIGAGLAGASTANWSVPEGFDANGFLDAAKRNFVTLQAAWDKGDISTLRSMMTDEMLAEIRHQLEEREVQSAGVPNQTDVVMIDAQLLGIEEIDQAYMASVEFSGMIREDVSAGPSPFREVWNMTKPKDNSSGWLVAGLQALD